MAKKYAKAFPKKNLEKITVDDLKNLHAEIL